MYVCGSQVLLADQPDQFKLDISALAHHRRLVEKYGGWRPQVGSNKGLSRSMTLVIYPDQNAAFWNN